MILAIIMAKRASRRRYRDLRLVVFVADNPNPRVAKLAYGLRTFGWKVILIRRSEPDFDETRYFDEVKRYKNHWQALLLASRYAPRAYHMFSLTAGEIMYTFIRHKPGKVIYDAFDVIEGLIIFPGSEGEIRRQRYCIENADGLCCRDLRVRYVTRRFGYKRKGKAIFFPDYCWDFPEDSEPVVPHNGDEVHVVLMGSFGIEKLGGAEHGYLEFVKRFTEQGIHFHIYPRALTGDVARFGPADGRFKEMYSDFIALSERTPFFHLHNSIPFEALVSELRRYDMGISVIRAKIYGEKLSGFTDAHLRYCGSLRIMDYIDAGLPVIMSKQLEFQFAQLARFGLAMSATAELFENPIEHIKSFLSLELKQKLHEAKAYYSVHRHIGRLILFYEGL